MLKRVCTLLAAIGMILTTLLGGAQAPDSQPNPVLPAISHAPANGSQPPAVSSQRALVQRYCAGCHNDRQPAGKLSLVTADLDHVSDNPEMWEKVVRKVRAGLMPPAGRPRPDKATYDGFATWLETSLDRAAAANPNPGRTEPAHRLNRAEYQNAVRDLLGIDMDIASLLPGDDVSYGFDNIAGVLRMSPTLMERYLSAVKKITRVAVGTPPPSPNFDVFRMLDDWRQDDRLEGLPFGTRGGTVIHYNFAANGEYVMRVRLARQTGAQDLDVPRYSLPQELEVSLDGLPLKVFTLGPSQATGQEDDEETFGRARRRPAGTPAPAAPAAARSRGRGDTNKRGNLDDDWEFRFHADAGPRDLAVTFLNRTPALLETLVEPYQRPWNVGSNQWSSRKGAYVRSVEIGGPFNAAGTVETPSRRHIFICRPAKTSEEIACAKTILSTLARRAYRRPISDADLQRLTTFYTEGSADGGFDAGIELALQRLLMSPDFLFRTEMEPATAAPNTPYPISQLELASRLSFFLWSSIPDEELLDLAARGQLKGAGALEHQVKRMLADPRSKALVTNFAGQWLYLRSVPGLTRDPEKDPDFDEGLRQAFRTETELFFEHIMREDRSVLDLLTADYTFVNERLARHYGIPGVYGTRFRRVAIADPSRRGLLGQGSVLSVTSYPNRTSPVQRGKWVLDNLLGMPPPQPPPNVPELKDNEKDATPQTVRQRMEQHRANPACASCHALMDPLGFALENFDAAGRWRDVDETFGAIDTAGIFPDGTKIDGPASLRQALLNHSDVFVTTVTQKLLTYALGRGVEYYDAPAIRAIAHDAARHDLRFSSLVLGIVNSAPFQMRKAAAPSLEKVTAARP